MSTFLYQAPLAYSNLPDKLRAIENYHRFVKECKQHLLIEKMFLKPLLEMQMLYTY